MKSFFQTKNVSIAQTAKRKKHLLKSAGIILGLLIWLFYAISQMTGHITGGGGAIGFLAALGFYIGLPLLALTVLYVVLLISLLIVSKINNQIK